jgi:hypothetical protein
MRVIRTWNLNLQDWLGNGGYVMAIIQNLSLIREYDEKTSSKKSSEEHGVIRRK